ncbi:gamma-glutamylcyclotransferase [Aestuariibacter salexigens]|uniref:gamma-glutamylcyclotransferase n=1 Tax=Aestuariibacter salexigens TaxID=226010 RepID=UPI0003FAC85C|nr:gamma-glutamylcyclotransferase [Aestuariibacter salexigens]
MAHDTQHINKQRQNLDAFDEIWVFGYGSLIYKVDFPYLKSSVAHLYGYERRFWQGSHDHRGTPENPGRVLTLTPVPQARCFGRAFQVEREVFDHLDHREKNGYLREIVEIELVTENRIVEGLVYIASPENAAFLGEASSDDIARQIYHSSGPSGPNRDYVFQLADALREHNEIDAHVFDIESAICRIHEQK